MTVFGQFKLNFSEAVTNYFFRFCIPKTGLSPLAEYYDLTKENGQRVKFNVEVNDSKNVIFAVKDSFPKGESVLTVSLSGADYTVPDAVYEKYYNLQKGVPENLKSEDFGGMPGASWIFDELNKAIYNRSPYYADNGGEVVLVDYSVDISSLVGKKLEIVGRTRKIEGRNDLIHGGIYFMGSKNTAYEYANFDISSSLLKREAGRPQVEAASSGLYNWDDPHPGEEPPENIDYFRPWVGSIQLRDAQKDPDYPDDEKIWKSKFTAEYTVFNDDSARDYAIIKSEDYDWYNDDGVLEYENWSVFYNFPYYKMSITHGYTQSLLYGIAVRSAQSDVPFTCEFIFGIVPPAPPELTGTAGLIIKRLKMFGYTVKDADYSYIEYCLSVVEQKLKNFLNVRTVPTAL
ncbi:MAG: hypothetical protein LBU81_00890 [Methanosarcinales archaeon]|jgi:hypothetical protein|nr:hypothetical protein [Methanosarcinales archaeon]